MPSDSEKQPPSEADDEKLLDPAAKIPVVLELHEVIALCLLYERSPDDLDLMIDDSWYGPSLDRVMLTFADALAKFIGDKELRLVGGAIRAMLDQQQ